MKKFFKKLKENFLLKTTASEWILLIAVIALITFKFVSENRKTNGLQAAPVGDFGPSPYEIHANSQDKN